MLHSDFGPNAMISSGIPHPDFMGRAIRVALVALVVSVSAAPHVSAQQELTYSLFERYVESLRVQVNIPGMSAAIVQNERVVWKNGFGFADVEHAVRARADTPYHIPVLTEGPPAARILEQGVETSHIALDDRVQRRAMSAPDATITIRDALTHRSSSGGFKYDPARYAALTGVVETCISQDLMPFREALFEKVFYRANMFDSVPAQNVDDASADDRVQFDAAELDRFNGVLKRLALPYRVSGNNVALNTSVGKSVNASTGAISTVLDLATFDSRLDGAFFLHRETMSAMWSKVDAMPTGLGWFVQTYNGQTLYWQFGNTPGAYSSLILKVPSRHLTVILLANSDGLSAAVPLQDGDISTSLFARTFLRLFVG